MRVTRCLFNSRTALHRVFISPYEKVEALSRCSALSAPTARVLLPVAASIPNLSRHASMVHRYKKRGTGRPDNRENKNRPPENDRIRDRNIMVVDEENKLAGPYSTAKVLLSLDLEKETLRMVSPAPSDPGPDQPAYAVCKIIDIQEERARTRKLEQAKKLQAKANKTKELEINWAIASNDLNHKMRQLRTFLTKGFKVEVLMAKKKGSRVATADEAQALVQAVRDVVEETRGAKEYKASEGQPLKVMRLYLSGKAGQALAEDGSEAPVSAEDGSEAAAEGQPETSAEDQSEMSAEASSETSPEASPDEKQATPTS
ncbi:translation initiation factor [Colletotrichum kahawae]|uniref:Translation initiation factor n=1 Tax=Colletotrichum kahawae TaxID=34407 RepID=A0AAD9YD26_COLKA|nr:translation initiation factor [Colletotrichum kahawae]